MGNTVPRRTSREGKRSKRDAEAAEAPAAPRRVAFAQRHNLQEREEQVMKTTRAGGGEGDGAPAGATVTVKIMMRRKDAEALVARLHAQSARERKARMAELRRQIRAGDGGARPASLCRDAWRPRLAPVEENQC